MLHHLIQREDLRERLSNEIQTVVIDKYLAEEKPEGNKIDYMRAFDIERLREMNYLTCMFNEALRLDTPTQATMNLYMKKTEKIGKITM